MKQYLVKKIFATIQGEGFHAGRAAIFIRLVGCNLWSGQDRHRQRDATRNRAHCPLWCDTDFTKKGAERMTAEDIAQRVSEISENHDFVVITGGEPLLQVDHALCCELHRAGFEIAIETNGTLNPDFLDHGGVWITCSPKMPWEQVKLPPLRINELKFVLPSYPPPKHSLSIRRVYVVPEDGPRFEMAVQMCVDHVARNPTHRISTQTHKALRLP